MVRTISHSLMVHARFLEDYIHFALMYTEDHVLPILSINELINKYGDPTTPFKLTTGTKTSVSFLCVLFCLCVVRKATAHVGKKVLNMRHQAQKGFRVIFIGIPKNQIGYIVYIPHTHGILYLHTMFFLVRVYLVCWYIRHNHIQKRWICNWMCR